MNEYKFSNIEIGLEESFEVKIDASKMDKFLDISNDINPLHVDSNYAEKKGFPGRVVYGLLTSSFYSTLVGVHLPGKHSFLQGIDIQFSKPVYIGDTVTAKLIRRHGYRKVNKFVLICGFIIFTWLNYY